ncbi:hypothetical protein BGX31_003102, partial [Mortierella sp. GBA43]
MTDTTRRKKNYLTQQKHQVWCNKVLESGGNPNVRKFTEAFPHEEEGAAHTDYGRLLESDAIDDKVRRALKKEFLDWKLKNRKSKKRRPSEKGKEVDTRPLLIANPSPLFTLLPEVSLESDGVAGLLFPEVEPEDEEGHEDEKEDHGDGDEGDSQITVPFESLASWMHKLKSYPSAQKPQDKNKDRLQGTPKALYEYAEANLSRWDRLHVLEKKSTMVAVSGILDTMDVNYQAFEDYDRVKQECLDITFMEATGEAKSITLELLNLMTSDDNRCLRMVMRHCLLQVANAEDALTLRTLRTRLYNVAFAMCFKIFTRAWKNTSEAVAVASWKEIVRMLPPPTTITRTDGNDEDAGSSCDIVVFEAMRDGSNQMNLDTQTRKKSSICAHWGLNIKKELLILDTCGCKANVYTIKKFEGFLGAGRVMKGRLELP